MSLNFTVRGNRSNRNRGRGILNQGTRSIAKVVKSTIASQMSKFAKKKNVVGDIEAWAKNVRPGAPSIISSLRAPSYFEEEDQETKISKLNLNRNLTEEEEEAIDLAEIAANVSTESQIYVDIKNTLRNMLRKPLTMIIMVIAVVVVISHSTGMDKGFLADFLKDYNSSSVVVWLSEKKNFEKFLGMIVYIPAVIDIGSEYRMGVMLVVGLWVFFMPNFGLLEYFVQAVIIHTFVKVRLNDTRIFLVICSIICFFLGIITFGRGTKKLR